MELIYREHEMARPLCEAVSTFWSFAPLGNDPNAPMKPLPYRVLPDGCADLILRYSPSNDLKSSYGSLGKCALLISGVLTRYKIVEIVPHATLWGMQLRPGWVEPILGIRPHELPNGLEPAERHTPRLAELTRTLRTVTSPEEAELALQLGMTRLVEAAWERQDIDLPPPHLLEALRLLETHGGQLRMKPLARAVGMSERNLHRQLSRSLGMTPKLFARILRFQETVARLRDNGTDNPLDLPGLTPTTLPKTPYPVEPSF